jgi:hypothetical protein|tara:strand:+ start:138 stop:254 length:117 start_codon:yes stop_codon:yes gene_type:complete
MDSQNHLVACGATLEDICTDKSVIQRRDKAIYAFGIIE